MLHTGSFNKRNEKKQTSAKITHSIRQENLGEKYLKKCIESQMMMT